MEECEEIFKQFKCIYEKRQKLYGGHSDARLVIQSAKNCGESCVKLANILRGNEASIDEYIRWMQTAKEFYETALGGQRKYMGEANDYYTKINDLLEALSSEMRMLRNKRKR